MAMSFDFKPIQYNDIMGRIRNANKDFYSSIGGMIEGVGTGAKDIASAHTAEEERKKREEEEKKKWDNMLAEQAYRKKQDELSRRYQEQRDLINDTRYNNEYGIKQAEKNKSNEMLGQMKSELGNILTEEEFSKMTPSEKIAAIQMRHATSPEMFANAYGNYNNAVMQKNMGERTIREDKANELVRRINVSLSKNDIRLGSNDYPRMKGTDRLGREILVPNKVEISRQLEGLYRYLDELNRSEDENEATNALRYSINKKIEILQLALEGFDNRSFYERQGY